MICQTCHGNGYITFAEERRYEPCPTCNGSGTDHCCDGDQPSDRDRVLLSFMVGEFAGDARVKTTNRSE